MGAAKDVQPGPLIDTIRPRTGPPGQAPSIIVTFYDQRREIAGVDDVGSFNGTFPWRKESGKLRVPLAAREAILRIGLQGATGELSLDDLRISPSTPH